MKTQTEVTSSTEVAVSPARTSQGRGRKKEDSMAKVKSITTFDLEEAKRMRVRLQEVLDKFADSLGIGVQLGNATYKGNALNIAVEFIVKNESGVLQTDERKAFRSYAKTYGLEPEWLDKTFTQDGKTFKIVGLNGRKPKRPILCEDDKGGSYSFPELLVKGLMQGDVEGAYRDNLRKEYLRWGKVVGLEPEWLDKPFEYNGETVTAIGMNDDPRALEGKVVIRRKDGEKFLLSSALFKGAMTGNLEEAKKKELEQRIRDFEMSYRTSRFKYDGLELDWLGKSFTSSGKTYMLIGLDPKSKRYPIVAQGADHKLYQYKVADLIRLMKQAA
jgi:hypothetical protein